MTGRFVCIALLSAFGACSSRDRPPAATGFVPLDGAVVLIGAGDIAGCDQQNDQATAMLVDSVLAADSVAGIEDAVFTLGDNAYTDGSAAQFARCFTPTWGDPAKRIMRKIHPAAGNHDHYTPGAGAYYQYFGDRAGRPGEGYYSYDLGGWHVIVLNSELIVNAGFSDSARTAQEVWLAGDLEGHPAKCALAYWHHPRFTSGLHGSDPKLDPVWRLLYKHGVDLVLNGHDHDYERFLPQTPAGLVDSARGITEIVAGTGGEDLRPFGSRIERHSAARLQGRAGVLLLSLGAAEYRSVFLDVTGRQWDASSGACH